MRIKAAIALGIAGATLTTLAAAGVASANDVTLYENSNWSGATVDVYSNVYDFAGWHFSNGHNVKNNTASAWNWGPQWASIYVNHGYAGNQDILQPGQGVTRLGYTYNNNASLEFWG